MAILVSGLAILQSKPVRERSSDHDTADQTEGGGSCCYIEHGLPLLTLMHARPEIARCLRRKLPHGLARGLIEITSR